MTEKFTSIETELSQLSSDLAQMLSRIATVQQHIATLKSELQTLQDNYNIRNEQAADPTSELPDECITTYIEDCQTQLEETDAPESYNDITVEAEEALTDIITDSDNIEPENNAIEPDITINPLQATTCDDYHCDNNLQAEAVNQKITEPTFPNLPPIPPLVHDTPQYEKYESPKVLSPNVNSQDTDCNELEDLRKLFTINDRYRFRRELFGNDTAAMSDTIDLISAMKSISEAEDYVYSDLEWDKENDDVRAFMDIITFYFLRKR